ncbi:MAG: 50S ribosomal protein L23 [Pseudomonadota bacterium]
MSWKYLRKTRLAQDKLYDVIRAPVITEKATLMGQDNRYAFKVAPNADKLAIKQAVEQLFGVKVQTVNTVRIKGKQKRFRGRVGVRPDYKKAFVTLRQGDSIDMATGL